MPTIISHSIVGLSAGKILSIKNVPKRFWVLSAVCPILPDADIIGYFLGIPYEHFLGHRGFFHSIFFALILSIFVVSIFFRKDKVFSKRWFIFTIYFFVITSSHGVLDAFTSGGLGIALLSPFDNTRYFFPFAPIQVSPIGIKAFFSEWGLRVIISEFIWVWLPSISIVFFSALFRRK